MISFLPLLGQAESGPSALDESNRRLIMFSIYAAVVLLIAGWAIFFRKHKKKRRRIHRPHGWQQPPEERKHRHSGHRRHRSKSDHLPMNPTLAQSRGLPPVRPDDVPPHGD